MVLKEVYSPLFWVYVFAEDCVDSTLKLTNHKQKLT